MAGDRVGSLVADVLGDAGQRRPAARGDEVRGGPKDASVVARSRESQARFVCISCGHDDHADINIERWWNTPSLRMEGL